VFFDAAGTMFRPLTLVTSMTTQMPNRMRPSRDAKILTIGCVPPRTVMSCAQFDRRQFRLSDCEKQPRLS